MSPLKKIFNGDKFGDDVIVLRARRDMIKTRQLQLEVLLFAKLAIICQNIWFPLELTPEQLQAVKTFYYRGLQCQLSVHCESIIDEQIAEISEALRL